MSLSEPSFFLVFILFLSLYLPVSILISSILFIFLSLLFFYSYLFFSLDWAECHLFSLFTCCNLRSFGVYVYYYCLFFFILCAVANQYVFLLFLVRSLFISSFSVCLSVCPTIDNHPPKRASVSHWHAPSLHSNKITFSSHSFTFFIHSFHSHPFSFEDIRLSLVALATQTTTLLSVQLQRQNFLSLNF